MKSQQQQINKNNIAPKSLLLMSVNKRLIATVAISLCLWLVLEQLL